MSIFPELPSEEEIAREEESILKEDFVDRMMEAAARLGFTGLKREDFQKQKDALIDRRKAEEDFYRNRIYRKRERT
jgi:hypothetical protein